MTDRDRLIATIFASPEPGTFNHQWQTDYEAWRAAALQLALELLRQSSRQPPSAAPTLSNSTP